MYDELMSEPHADGFCVGGLFAGIGGIERGFHSAGHRTSFFCECEPAARAVLRDNFGRVPLFDDVRELPGKVDDLPHVDVLVGGFPCQDLSQAGKVAGIGGARSGLVGHMFQLLDRMDERKNPPTWFVVENVTNMLALDRGRAMEFLTGELERRGYGWAYRVVDTIAFGLPQRRKRVLMVASKRLPMAPARILFADEGCPREERRNPDSVGFYWTEGLRGVGWAPDAVPTLKGGSGVGIPSPPAVWWRERPAAEAFFTLSIEQAERLQGFPVGWTDVVLPEAGRSATMGERWRMVGNAVSVPVAEWLGRRMTEFGSMDELGTAPSMTGRPSRWPDAASGYAGRVWVWPRSNYPLDAPCPPLTQFVTDLEAPLSLKAALGFRERSLRGRLRLDPQFLQALDDYLTAHDVAHEDVRKLSRERHRAAEARRRMRSGLDKQLELG